MRYEISPLKPLPHQAKKDSQSVFMKENEPDFLKIPTRFNCNRVYPWTLV